MESLQTKKLSKKLKEYFEKGWWKFIKSIEKNSWEDLYLFKKDNKYYLIDKKLRNKFIPKEWIYENLEWTAIYIKKDFADTLYLVVELSGVNMYFTEKWKDYSPKNLIKQVKNSLINILWEFINNLWILSTFSPKTKKISNPPKNDNINYKKFWGFLVENLYFYKNIWNF